MLIKRRMLIVVKVMDPLSDKDEIGIVFVVHCLCLSPYKGMNFSSIVGRVWEVAQRRAGYTNFEWVCYNVMSMLLYWLNDRKERKCDEIAHAPTPAISLLFEKPFLRLMVEPSGGKKPIRGWRGAGEGIWFSPSTGLRGDLISSRSSLSCSTGGDSRSSW